MSKTPSITRKIVLITGLLMIYNSAFAQIDWSKSRFGFRVSPSVAWLKVNTSDLSGGSKIGFSYGVIADIGFTENYAFGTGVEICYKGGSLSGVVNSGNININYEGTFNLQYIEIPLTLKLRTNQIGYLKYYGQFGVCAALNIDAGGEIKINGNVQPNVNPGNSINKFNAAMIIGAGVEYPVSGNTSLVGGLTFNNGFINILDNPYDSKAITNYVALNIGVLF